MVLMVLTLQCCCHDYGRQLCVLCVQCFVSGVRSVDVATCFDYVVFDRVVGMLYNTDVESATEKRTYT